MKKSTSYFLNLEKHNFENKNITQLQIGDEKVITERDEILKEQYNFYKKLYSKPVSTGRDLQQCEAIFLENIVPELNEDLSSFCEGLLSEPECLCALKGMENNKSPGIDGFPIEFYKFFWNDIKNLVIQSLNYAFVKGSLSKDQKRGLITLVPKKDKDRLFLKNWRPIALLNSDYKLLAKSLANRIKSVMDNLISTDQTGYLPGRYIGENIRTVSDIITYLKQCNKSGIILQIDFEKAFDSVDWNFIDKTLVKFKFGADFRKWVRILYNDSQSAVTNNGFITQFFNLQRGVRQGCPLSVYLFLLVAEILAIKIRSQENIRGISIKNTTIKISQMADDTTIFLENKEPIPHLLQLFDNFANCSGLKINVEKTEAYYIGPREHNHNTFGLKWINGPMKLLGLTIICDNKVNFEKKFHPKLKLMKDLSQIWSQRNLSLKGKVTIINTLIISLFVYPISILPTPPAVLEEIDTSIFKFLWGNKPPKIAKNVIQNEIHTGGLKMPNIFLKAKSWKLMWLKRALLHPDRNWVKILDGILNTMKFVHIIQSNLLQRAAPVKNLPKFYQDIISSLATLESPEAESAHDIQNQQIWFDRYITIEKKPIFWKVWYQKGIIYIRDLLDDNANFLTQDQLKFRYDLNCNFLDVLKIRQSIPYPWRNMIRQAPTKAQNIPQLLLHDKSNATSQAIVSLKSKDIYWLLYRAQNKSLGVPASHDKWSEALDLALDTEEWNTVHKIPFRATHETYIQSFQYKVLHRIIPCNHWLYKLKIVISPNCKTCGTDDTLIHYFMDYERVQNFWNSFDTWWYTLTNTRLVIDPAIVIFGIPENTLDAQVLNFCLVMAKLHIYKTKQTCDDKHVTLYDYLRFLKSKLDLYYMNAEIKLQGEKFDKKWGFLYHAL